MGQGANVSTVFETPGQQGNGVTPYYEGEEPHGNTDLHDACNRGNLSQVKSILSQGSVDIDRRGTDGRTAVMLAAHWGNSAIFNVIIEKKPDVSKFDKLGNSILHLACLGGDMKIVKYVLSQNMADINSKNQNGETPVMLAALQGQKQLLLFLLGQHADMSPLDNAGNNILHLACCGGNIEVVNYVLLQNIVHIDSRGREGKTPAMMAAEKGRKSVLDLLKSNGADLSLKDNFSNDVYQLARRNGHEELISKAAPRTRGCEVM
ncbi:ankyrin repeat domain-containing protein 50-like isoform X1 [Haliotis rufescens]|uniref:ankyrin repeat domain-containing protein 50-like isoform X1 n=1 Tax=Haliotis rufescens TaxID=6454 RepID=UPI00201F54D9|nr:ankyrin repeat domain-containing protein 50-like isoform X1 [Haliotis rufescens]XP_048247109.1 ankyrin repeat domain-containing protein 50-like isoform X1 [Haliotis rufescens]